MALVSFSYDLWRTPGSWVIVDLGYRAPMFSKISNFFCTYTHCSYCGFFTKLHSNAFWIDPWICTWDALIHHNHFLASASWSSLIALVLLRNGLGLDETFDFEIGSCKSRDSIHLSTFRFYIVKATDSKTEFLKTKNSAVSPKSRAVPKLLEFHILWNFYFQNIGSVSIIVALRGIHYCTEQGKILPYITLFRFHQAINGRFGILICTYGVTKKIIFL